MSMREMKLVADFQCEQCEKTQEDKGTEQELGLALFFSFTLALPSFALLRYF